jgi:hypothetical protein
MRGSKFLISSLVFIPLLVGAGCGNVSNLSLGGSKDCGTDQACFDEKFKTCSPAHITNKIQDGLVRTSDIVGMKDGKCDVESEFIENTIAPEMLGKKQVCHLDSSKSYTENQQIILSSGARVGDICEGPLMDYLNKLNGGN